MYGNPVQPAGAPSEIGLMWQEAMNRYAQTTGGQHVTMTRHTASVSEIMVEIDEMVKSFNHQRHDGSRLDRFRTLIRETLAPIQILSEIAAHASKAVFPPSEAIFVAIRHLIATVNTMSGDYNKLTEFFQDVHFFLDGIQTWENQVPSFPELKRAIVGVFGCVLVLCGLYTRYIRRKRLVQAFKVLISGEDTELREAYESFQKMVQHGRDIVQNTVFSTVQQTGQDIRAMHSDLRNNISSLNRVDERLSSVARESERTYQFLKNQERDQILSWFSTLNFGARQRDVYDKHHEGTGQWLLDSAEFQQWMHGPHSSTVWCPGDPGTGKTVMMSAAICHVEQHVTDTEKAIAFVYCDYKESKTHRAPEIWSSIIRQLAEQCHFLPPEIETFRDKFIKKRSNPNDDDRVSLLKSLSKRFGKTYVFIDALDECPEQTREEFLVSAKRVEKFFRLFITSRHSVDLEGRLSPMTRIDIAAHQDDVRAYLEATLKNSARLGRILARNAQLKHEIIDKILSQVNGMFLLAHLHMEHLSFKHRPHEIRQALDTMPKDVHEFYGNTIKRILDFPNADDTDLALRVLAYIFYARRPLSMEELLHALSVDPGATDLDIEALHQKDIVDSVSSGLIRVDNDSCHVSLTHYTVYEHLQQFCQNLLGPYERKFSEACLTYLLFEPLGEGPCADSDGLLKRLQDYCFLDYACRYWASHATSYMDELICGLATTLLLHKDKIASCAQLLHFPRRKTGRWYEQFPRNFTNLHAAAYWGLNEVLQTLLLYNRDVNCRDSYGTTPLLLSARYGHQRVAEQLLVLKADVDAQNNNGESALTLAAKNGHVLMVELLLAHGSNDTAQDNEGWTSLHWATMGGHNDVVKSLLHWADYSNVDKAQHNKALILAAEAGTHATVQMLLDEGADIEYQDDQGSTPLHWAVPEGHEEVCKVLLKNGANPNSSDNYGNTPMHWAISHSAIARLLLDYGANINAKNHLGQGALLWGVLAGRTDAVETLVELGADTNASNNYGFTALHAAALSGHEPIVRLLLSNNADPNMHDQDGWTPLHAAALLKTSRLTQLLIERTNDGLKIAARVAEWLQDDDKRALLEEMADRKSVGSSVVTGLRAAVNNGHELRLLSLLENGADINAEDDVGGSTALTHATWLGQERTVRLLLDHGADVNARERSGRTGLHWAASHGYSALVQILVEHGGAEVDLKVFGWTAMLLAARDWHAFIVTYLLGHGANPDAQDFHGRSALHWSCIHGDKQLVKEVIDAGASINLQDSCGQTALHWAVARKDPVIVNLLLRRNANAGVQATDGSTVLHLAAYTNQINVIKMFFKDKKRREQRVQRVTQDGMPKPVTGVVALAVRDKDGLSAADIGGLAGNYEAEQHLKYEQTCLQHLEPNIHCFPDGNVLVDPLQRNITSEPPQLNIIQASENDYLSDDEFNYSLGKPILNREVRKWLRQRLQQQYLVQALPITESPGSTTTGMHHQNAALLNQTSVSADTATVNLPVRPKDFSTR